MNCCSTCLDPIDPGHELCCNACGKMLCPICAVMDAEVNIGVVCDGCPGAAMRCDDPRRAKLAAAAAARAALAPKGIPANEDEIPF